MSFSKTPGWLDWHPSPAKPTFSLPQDSVDAHCHVFGPGDRFPYASGRKYTPCDASKEQLFALRDHLGVGRNVIVQATCHGTDNRAMLDACRASEGQARGVAALPPSIADRELRQLHDAGVRGVRFNFLRRLAIPPSAEDMLSVSRRIAPLGWHVVVYFEAHAIPVVGPLLARIPTVVVIDHLGRPDVSKSVDGPEFGQLLGLMQAHGHLWCKVSCPERLTRRGGPARRGDRPPYPDVIPFSRQVIESFPDRVLWGTDWPHPNLTDHMPDDGQLVDFIPHIAVTTPLQQKLLVTNPLQLYWAQ